MNSVPRALKRHHAKRGASAKAEVRENAKCKCGLGFAKHFCGRRIRKTETDFFEKFLGLFSAPQEGRGRNAGRKFFWFFGGGLEIQKQKIKKLSLSFISLCIIPV
jgi:hypothetical protein